MQMCMRGSHQDERAQAYVMCVFKYMSCRSGFNHVYLRQCKHFPAQIASLGAMAMLGSLFEQQAKHFAVLLAKSKEFEDLILSGRSKFARLSGVHSDLVHEKIALQRVASLLASSKNRAASATAALELKCFQAQQELKRTACAGPKRLDALREEMRIVARRLSVQKSLLCKILKRNDFVRLAKAREDSELMRVLRILRVHRTTETLEASPCLARARALRSEIETVGVRTRSAQAECVRLETRLKKLGIERDALRVRVRRRKELLRRAISARARLASLRKRHVRVQRANANLRRDIHALSAESEAAQARTLALAQAASSSMAALGHRSIVVIEEGTEHGGTVTGRGTDARARSKGTIQTTQSSDAMIW